MSDQLRFFIPGVPPNWLNAHLPPIAEYRAKKPWLEHAKMLGAAARHVAGWQPAEQGEYRRVELVIHHRQLYDREGAYAALKPVVDGLKRWLYMRNPAGRGMMRYPGAGLIWDDSDEFVDELVRQEKLNAWSSRDPGKVEIVVTRGLTRGHAAT